MSDIGIVVPILNESICLQRYYDYYRSLSSHAMLIFVDGGSNDTSVDIAQQLGCVIHCQQGRSIQKNAGAAVLDVDIVLFLHVDTTIQLSALQAIKQAVDDGADAGCFTLQVSDGGMFVKACALLVNLRAQLFNVLDGDLGLFVRKDVFDLLGGFDDVMVMEDVFFGDKLKKSGRTIDQLPHVIDASARKWREYGFSQTLWRYTCIYWQYWLGEIKPGRNI